MPLRWGIVSAGLISNDFTTVLNSLPSSDHQVWSPTRREGEKTHWDVAWAERGIRDLILGRWRRLLSYSHLFSTTSVLSPEPWRFS